MFELNEKVLIPSLDNPNKETVALFKGYISETQCYVKPKTRFVKGGYGTTITCLVSNVKKFNNNDLAH